MPAPSSIIPDTARTDWTVEELAQLPDDGNRYEILDGALLVSPAPVVLHQLAAREVVTILLHYLEGTELELFFAPTAVREGARTEIEPDVFVVPTRTRSKDRFIGGIRELVLAIEVTSPTTARVDRYRKRAAYQRYGVPNYWIIDPAARFVESWRPSDTEPEILETTLTWQPVAEQAPLVIDLVRYFQTMHGE